ncbi:MAG TPA: hypothetical protein VLZ10_20665 [Thermodesulfobacteriota bacterium]|nr:hypothetical protein [Thermodesulfobacteriota bacterium]
MGETEYLSPIKLYILWQNLSIADRKGSEKRLAIGLPRGLATSKIHLPGQFIRVRSTDLNNPSLLIDACFRTAEVRVSRFVTAGYPFTF